MAAAFFGAGFSSESESESLELSFLAAAFFFGAGLASEDSESESLEDSFLAAFLAGAAFLTGLASEELSESEELSFLAAFFAGAAFLTGLASDELSESEEDSFLAGAFLAGFLMTCTDSDEESESLLDSTFFFFCATFWASLVLATFLELSLLTLDAALDLFSMTFFGGSEESLSESDEDSTFLTGFFFSFFSASFLDLFLVSSILCFLDGASDELADTFFYNLEKIS